MKYETLTHDRLKEMLSYEPLTGVFTWKARPFRNSRKKIGDVAGVEKGRGYRYIGIDGRQYLGSQLAWFYVHGVWPKGEIGVKNKTPSDLRIENLAELKTAPGKHQFDSPEGYRAYGRAHRLANPGLHRGYGFKRYYGIDTAEYQRMFAAQGGVCAICAKVERAKTPAGEIKWLSVDHHHESGAVRELLCSHCNHTLGHANDDPIVLRAAADYLERHARRIRDKEVA